MRRNDHRRPLHHRLATALAGAMLVLAWGVAVSRDAPFDKAPYETRLPLTTWMDPVELAEEWQDRRVFLKGVYLIAEGPGQNEFYATSCKTTGEAAATPESLEVRCPWVYLGKLQPEEARERLQLIGERKINVYFTVGQIVPRRFARQFGMLEAKDGAWVEVDGDYVHIIADTRVFKLPEDVEAAAAAEPSEPAGPPRTAEEAEAYLSFGYRLLHEEKGQEIRTAFRPLNRASILGGRAEFIVETSAPEWFSIEGVTVTGHEGVYLRTGRLALCASSSSSNSCTADFGPGVARQRITVEAAVRNVDGVRFTVARDFATLDTHPYRIGTASSGTRRASGSAEQPPPNEVIRLVRIENEAGRGAEGRTGYRVDLPPEAFRVDVAGIEGATIKSVTLPAAARESEAVPLLIPIFINVSAYLNEEQREGAAFGWLPSYAGGDDGGIVRKLGQGLEWAAWSGVDAEFIVVDYAATARMFGPFRLHHGRQLTDDQKAQNRRTLDALASHLRQPPLPEWRTKRSGTWASDIGDPLLTLNDLYFRAHPGPVAALLLTDGRNNPIDPRPLFLPDLWPERLVELDRALTSERSEAILGLLDAGRSLHDEATGRILGTAEETGTLRPEVFAAYLRGLDPGGTSALHPRREYRLPPMDALIVPSDTAPRREQQRTFGSMIREDFGGEVYRLYTVRKTPAKQMEQELRVSRDHGDMLTLGQMIHKIYDQLRASYVVVAEIPNAEQGGARQELTIGAVEAHTTPKGKTKHRPIEGRLRHVPTYTSSRSVREELPAWVQSPIAPLRLIAAHESRNHWDDSTLYGVLMRQAEVETNPAVGRVLLESAIAIELKRLQVTAEEIADANERRDCRRRAYDRLQALGEKAEDLADPPLARDAALLARRHREETGEY